MLIYKIMSLQEWTAFENAGVFEGAAIDLSDGYIHFSTATQMRETAAKHFAGRDDLMLVWGEDEVLAPDLKWEVSRGGAKFPHLYRAWKMGEVAGHAPLPLVDGVHQFPDAPS